jgi:hypothetical protein
MQISLTSCQHTNKIGNVIWKGWKETAFHNWHSITDQINEYDGDDDVETKAILGFWGQALTPKAYRVRGGHDQKQKEEEIEVNRTCRQNVGGHVTGDSVT